MAHPLWRGSWQTKARIVSGLILFTYVFLHLFTVGLGLFSINLMEAGRSVVAAIVGSIPGQIAMGAAFLVHMGLALARLAYRSTLKMPLNEVVQIALGITIPFLLIVHFVHTNLAERFFDLNPAMGYIVGLIWDTPSGWQQAALVLVVWAHGCIGLYLWLRVAPFWSRIQPFMIALAALWPAFALSGFMVQGRAQSERLFRSDERDALFEEYNFPTGEAFGQLKQFTDNGLTIAAAILALTAAVFVVRRLLVNRHALRIRYVDGPEIHGKQGMTLLEMSRAAGVPHLALCGGRGRCTTCRVIVEDGAEFLPPPSPQEAASLQAVNAAPGARLACQLRPTEPATVLRMFRADGRRARDHQSLGQERRLAVLFLDMRGFTARTTGQLPYDVVFLLNRFFDAIVPSIIGAGGTVDKYLGDGLMAMFEMPDEHSSARAALDAAAGVGSALKVFNQTLIAEKSDPVAIGIGLHLGELVLGEIGSADNAPRTIIGDTVNAASRIEGQTKELGVELLVSVDVLDAAGKETETLDMIELNLRGVAHPVQALAVKQAADLPALLKEKSPA